MAAARPSAQNLGLIAGAIVAWWRAEPMWIAAGFLAAYLALAAWGFADIASRGVGLRLRRAELAAAGDAMRGVWRAVRVLLLVPVLLQIHLIIERRVASIVSDAAVAALDYARFLADTSVLLLAMPLGIAGLGVMASLELKPFRDLAQRSLRLLLYVGMPLSLVLALHAEPLVRAIFGRGAFGAESIATTSVILSWLAPGLWARLLGYAGAKFLSARGRNVCVIGIHALAVSANVAVNVLLYPTLGAGALGLGAAVSGIVFGLGVVLALGLFGRLLPDLATLGGLAAAYVALWLLAPAVIAAAGWLTLTLFVGYWTAAAALVPRCRHVVLDAWLSFRTA
jgi:putative peptidoglycan lipid II flippase